jgi:PilZ domain
MEQRSEPRLTFGETPGPVLEAEGRSFPIVDLSAGGVRFVAPSAEVTIGELVRGTIRLAPDRAFLVEGRVLRTGQDEVAARLEGGQPVDSTAARPRPLRGLHW